MRRQSGFVHSAVMDLVFLFVLILLLLGLWKLLSTVVESDFALGAFLLWLMGAALMYWFSREDVRVLRVPLGFLLFSAGAAVLAPLSWWSESKLAVIAAAAVLVNAAFVAGNRGSRKLRQRLGSGSEPPFYLDQSINLLDDLFRWLGVSILAWFAVGLLPLLLVFVVPIEWIPWAAMVWGFGATAYFFLAVRKSRVRFLRLPLGLWALAAAMLVLKLFQDRIAGPLEPGSVGLIGYSVYYPVAAALFVEIVLLGTPAPPPAATPTPG